MHLNTQALQHAKHPAHRAPHTPSRAKTLEDRHQLNPRYAGDSESIKESIARDVVFRERYAAARPRWLVGDRRVIRPAGTCAMKRWHGVPCEMPD